MFELGRTWWGVSQTLLYQIIQKFQSQYAHIGSGFDLEDINHQGVQLKYDRVYVNELNVVSEKRKNFQYNKS